MRTIAILGGVMLLLLACGGVVCWVLGFDMFKQVLGDGVMVSAGHKDYQTPIPGTLIVVLAIAVPIACGLAGIWLVRSGFEKDDKPNT